MATKPKYGLPLDGTIATKQRHDAEINRVLGILWDAAVVAHMGTPEAEALVTEFLGIRADVIDYAQRTEAAAVFSVASLEALLESTGSLPLDAVVYVRAEGYSYQVVSSAPDMTTAGGVMLRALPGPIGLKLAQFGVDPSDPSTDYQAQIAAALAAGWDEDLTYIGADLDRRILALNSLNQLPARTVITGDSLAFNGFGYAGEIGLDGAGYATDNPNGLMSWAHMLRDAIMSANPAFDLYYNMDISTNAALIAPSADGFIYRYGMNSQALKATFATAAQSLSAVYDYPSSGYLIIASAPAETAVTFESAGAAYDNLTNGTYLGYGYKLIPIPEQGFTITNVRRYADPAVPGGDLVIYGRTSNAAIVPALTGKGAWTSGQILAEYEYLVGRYDPKLVFYIIGANDIGTGVPVATTMAAIANFVGRVNAQGGHVVLISTPPTSSYSDAVALNLSIRMRQLAIATGNSFVDLIHHLRDVPVADWRFDNIHFNEYGDSLVYSIMAREALPTLRPSPLLTPERGALMGYGGVRRKLGGFHALFALPGLTVTEAGTSDIYQAAAATRTFSDGDLLIKPPTGYTVSDISFELAPEVPGHYARIVALGPDGTARVRFYNQVNGLVDPSNFVVGSLAVHFNRQRQSL